MAGAARVGPGRYMLVATISALAWAGTWTGAGYALHHLTVVMAPTRAEVVGFLLVTGVAASVVFAVTQWVTEGRVKAGASVETNVVPPIPRYRLMSRCGRVSRPRPGYRRTREGRTVSIRTRADMRDHMREDRV
jgi:hypothetical protein